MINCAIIGFGKMGQIRAKSINESGRGKIKLIYDPYSNSDLINLYAKETKDLEYIFNNQEIEAIFICTPNYKIPFLTIRALESKKHVFSEKPPGFTAQDVEEIRKSELQNKKICMFGFNHRHHKSIKMMKEIVNSNELGKILWMRGRYGKEVNQTFLKSWRADPKKAGAGILLDQGIHMLDLFIYLGGNFDICHSLISNLYWKIPNLEDNAFVLLKQSSSGLCASFHSTMTQWRYLFALEVFLEKGSLILNGLKTNSGVYGEECLGIKKNLDVENSSSPYEDQEYTFRFDTSWDDEIKHFFDAIEYGSEIKLGNTKDALNLMRHVDKIYHSDNRSLNNALDNDNVKTYK